MKTAFLSTLLFLVLSCNKTADSSAKNNSSEGSEGLETQTLIKINKDQNTIRERFPAPEGYEYSTARPSSFAEYIESFPLKAYGAPILKYDGTEIATQHLHEAVFDIDTGTKDLQQCADAIIRLRAEYLFKLKKYDEIKFHFTSGDLMTWNDYKNGIRTFVNGNSVQFKKTENFDDSRENFRKYLDLVFNYAGTISLNKETKPVLNTSDLKTGDILITAGSPGHIVFIAGVSENKRGEKLFLLAEGFTPAQSIHLLKNPFTREISPWYHLDVNGAETKTARYFFKPSNFRRF